MDETYSLIDADGQWIVRDGDHEVFRGSLDQCTDWLDQRENLERRRARAAKPRWWWPWTTGAETIREPATGVDPPPA